MVYLICYFFAKRKKSFDNSKKLPKDFNKILSHKIYIIQLRDEYSLATLDDF